MALVIPLDVSASPQTVPLNVETPVEQTVNGDYEQLANLPQINGVTLIGDKSAADLGLVDADDYAPVDKTEAMTQSVGKGADGKLYTTPSAGAVSSVNGKTGEVTLTASDVGAYSKPSGGIPKTDLAQAVQTSLGKADTALQSVPNTYRTAAAQDVIDAGKAPKSSGLYYGKCTTFPFDTHIFSVTIDGVTALETGTAILVWFQWGQINSNVPKLNVNGLGAKDIYRSSDDEAGLYEWGNGEILLLMYDGAHWVIADGNLATTAYYGVTKLENSATSTSSLTALTPSSLNSLVQSMLAPYAVYSSNATYAVGDRVRYGFNIYQCNTAISTAEAWNAAHWTQLDSLIEMIEAAAAEAAAKYAKPSGGIPKSDLAQAVQTSLDKADSYGSVYVTPEMFGAAGDGATDDAEAFEAALATGKTLLLPAKTYYLSRALVLSDDSTAYVTVRIVGSGKTESKIHLAGSFTTNKLGESIISDIGFYTEAADSNSAYVFPAALRNTRVSGCEFYRFDKIFYRLEQCCIITKNWFRSLYTTLCTQCVDAFITDNYLSGAGVKNPQTVLFPESLSSTTISGNFFSYCYKVFAVSSTMANVTITGNIFAVCYCIFYNNINGVTFTGNTIKWLKKQSGWDVSENSDMNTKPWAVLKRALDYSVATWWVESVFAGNTIDGDYDLYMDCGTGSDLTRYPTFNFTVDDVVPASKIVFSCAKSAVAGDMENVMIRPMLKRTVQVLPSAALTGSPIVSFDRDEVICDGVLYLNNGGTWVTASNVQTDWDAASGAAVLLNKPTIPTTPADIGAAAADLNITNASVGQVVTVSTVDANGKPTAFATATLLSAAGVSF